MQKWEYMKLRVEWTYTESGWQFVYEKKYYAADDLVLVMNELGQQGWEHISVVPFHTTIHRRTDEEDWIETSTERYDLFFKRCVE
jgi:hypothetical protein